MTFDKQPWALYRPNHEGTPVIVPPGSERNLLEAGVHVLMEGGMWRWPPMHVDYTRRINQHFSLKTLAVRPAMFELVASAAVHKLLEGVQEMAEQHPSMGRSLLENKVNTAQRSSHNAWVPYGSTSHLSSLFRHTASLLMVEPGTVSEAAGGFEDAMQVLKYNTNEHYDAHRDYWDPLEFPQKWRWTSKEGFWKNRFATVLWYLQSPDTKASNSTSGGETWFPRARGGPVPWGEWEACDKRGLLVPPTIPGVLFYSLLADGALDDYSWHCGCRIRESATRPKFAGNSWLWNVPSNKLVNTWQRSELEKDEF